MRRSIAAAALAASLAIGGLAGATLGTPSLAGADETPTAAAEPDGTPNWVGDALAPLVDDGTITQEQADAVESALGAAGPERRRGRGVHLEAVAEALGLEQEAVGEALRSGQTLAELAEQQGVDTEDLVAAVVAAREAQLADAVEDGRLTQAQADEIGDDLDERVTAMVEGEGPFRTRRMRGGEHFGRAGMHR